MNGLASAIFVVFLVSLFARITSKNKRNKKKDVMRQRENPNIKYSGRISRDENTVRYGNEISSNQSRNEKIANSTAGIRYMEGETVPEGYGVAKCAYCGAENLITKNHHGRYICYFCREFI